MSILYVMRKTYCDDYSGRMQLIVLLVERKTDYWNAPTAITATLKVRCTLLVVRRMHVRTETLSGLCGSHFGAIPF
jgi:hypothetical protein